MKKKPCDDRLLFAAYDQQRVTQHLESSIEGLRAEMSDLRITVERLETAIKKLTEVIRERHTADN